MRTMAASATAWLLRSNGKPSLLAFRVLRMLLFQDDARSVWRPLSRYVTDCPPRPACEPTGLRTSARNHTYAKAIVTVVFSFAFAMN